ncbi:MAG: RNA polymerase sigma factor SigF [Pseudanabaenaceae cyanobacterium SKYG29]|nr:RNA polymerase sigma factor SigF [Pseudanabaenaceae cyanobacterium SKYG29]
MCEKDKGATTADTVKTRTRELLELYQQNPTLGLRNQIVNLNIGLVRKEASHWASQCQESWEELMQVGCLGLIRAIERFDLSRGYAFSSFALPYIRGEIQHYLRDKSPTIKVPRRWQELYSEAGQHHKRLREELGREPTSQEIAQALQISVEEWQEIKLALQNRSPLSLDTPLTEDEDTTASLGDMLPDNRYRDFQLAQEDVIRLREAMSTLEKKTQQILEFVFVREFTYKEVAEMLGISAVTVSRQVKKGLKLLKELLMTPIDD